MNTQTIVAVLAVAAIISGITAATYTPSQVQADPDDDQQMKMSEGMQHALDRQADKITYDPDTGEVVDGENHLETQQAISERQDSITDGDFFDNGNDDNTGTSNGDNND